MTAIMIEAALRALAFAAVVGVGLRLLRVSNVPVRKAAWSLVLVASVAMPFLMRWPAAAGWAGRLGWAVPMEMQRPAMLKAEGTPAAVVMVTTDRSPDVVPADTAVTASPADGVVLASDDSPSTAPMVSVMQPRRLHWLPATQMIAIIYLTVAGGLMVRLLWGLGAALRLWMTADLVSPLVAPEPHVRSSRKIPSPVTIGSGIVLPANYTEWNMKKLRMVLAHEQSHVRQFDFYLQVLAGAYTALFWFSPLGWWLRRTLCSLGEAIGDRAGIDAAASRSGYAEVLLEFAAMPRQTLPGVAMARPGNLSHRIERLLNEHLFRSAFAEGRRRGVVSLLLIPAALFAVTALIRVPHAAAQSAPAAPSSAPAPAPAIRPDDQTAPASPDAPQDQTAPAPVPPAPSAAGAPIAPAAPAGVAPAAPADLAPAAAALSSGVSVLPDTDTLVSDDDQNANGYAYHFSNDGESYAIIEGAGTNMTFSGTFSGDWTNDRRDEIDAARRVTKGPFLWFTHQGKSYIVTDPAIVAKIRAMYKPMEALGQQQEALGRQQAALGKQQEALARAQEEAGSVKMPDLSKEMTEIDAAAARAKAEQDKWNTKELAEAEAKLKAAQDQTLTPEKVAELQAQLAAAQSSWDSTRMAEMQAKLGELQGRLGALQGEAGSRQGNFGEQMGKLGAEQGRLGSEQGKLGAEQGRLAAQADQQVRSLIDQCLRNGKATPVQNVK
ncbi:MAG: M56 family metallopeptidase [Acidobacteriaceae bacterium]